MRIAYLLILFVFSITSAACGGCGSGSGPKKLVPCGNGELDPDEICDPGIPEGEPGACPTSCGNELDPCSGLELQGIPNACDVECVPVSIQCGEVDSCCPAGCTEDQDSDCSSAALCGNGTLDPGEDCDPNITLSGFGACECPDPPGTCTEYVQGGDPTECEITCDTVAVTACVDGDGCCPSSCSAGNDSDCGDTCGDGVVGPTETCDGNCPNDCDDGVACTEDVRSGSSSSCNVTCSNDAINSCTDFDNCCPNGCSAANDSDCQSTCGDGIVDVDETCDGNCPTDCDDGVACTTDVRQGSAGTCDVVCINDQIIACTDFDNCCPNGCTSANDSDCSATCGDGIVDMGETCDGNCPTACDDMDVCTSDSLQGSAMNCSATCVFSDITSCIDGDGCCPPTCNATTDNDCSATCGNGIIEGNETCDGNCPTSCDDFDECTTNVLSGSPQSCTAECTYPDITQCIDADGCCPDACTFDVDDDCPCIPDTCASLGWTCGTVTDDGCGGGGEMCGTCAAGQTCVSNVCEDDLGVAAPCVTDGSCPDAQNSCITEAEFAWTDGYCTLSCGTDTDCGPVNHCSADGLCLRNCSTDGDCRSGYGCGDLDADGVDECIPLASGTGGPGAACTSYEDCSGGISGYCIPEGAEFLGGYCSADCLADTDCAAGSHCSVSGACVPDCVDSGSCRGSGYDCLDFDDDGTDECYVFGNGPGAVGDGCTGLWDCGGGEFAACIVDTGWTDGYCTILCDAGQGTCPNGSTCFDDGGVSYCVDDCQNVNQCRTGYQCTDPGNGSNACIP